AIHNTFLYRRNITHDIRCAESQPYLRLSGWSTQAAFQNLCNLYRNDLWTDTRDEIGRCGCLFGFAVSIVLCFLLALAFRAQTIEFQLMIFDGVSRLLSYQFFQIIQVIQRKSNDTTASVADNVMVVMFALFHQFIPDYTIPEYDPPKQSKSSQKFDGS